MHVHISDAAIRKLCLAVLVTDLFLLLMTALSDLQVPFATTKVALQADLKEEGVFAVWYSSLLLLLNSVAALAIAYSGRTSGTQSATFRRAWLVLALVFLGLSIDETSQIHERAAYVFAVVVGRVPYLSDERIIFGWVALFLPLLIAFVFGMVAVARTWLAFDPRSRVLALAGIACWVGVIGSEVFEAQQIRLGLERGLQGVFEEGLEIIGSTFFLFSFLSYLRTVTRSSPASEEQATDTHAWSRM